MYSGINPKRPRLNSSDVEPKSEHSVSTGRYAQTSIEPSERRPGTRGELGSIYEKKILLLGLYQSLKKGYDFILDTNIKNAGAMDDVVFTYKESDGIERRIYLQAKHKEDNNKNITYGELLRSGNDNYALYKYFIDYKEIIENFDNKCGIKSKYFIIYTNIDFCCTRTDVKGFRILTAKSKDKYFIFRQLDLLSNRPLDIFSTSDLKTSKKYPAFYQFSYRNKDEKARVTNVLKSKFKAIDRKKKIPKLTKISENDLDSKLEDYLNKLVFAVDQYDEKELGNQIKEEIKQTHLNTLIQNEVDFIFEYALNKIGQWKNRSEAVPLTEKDDFFKQGKDTFSTFPHLYPVLVYENELGASNIRFVTRKYEELNDFISSKKLLWLFCSETPWLDSLVIYQALNEETLKEKTGINYANHDHHLLLTERDLLKGCKFVIPAFKAMGQSLLIIACEPKDKNQKLKPFEVVNEIVKIVSASDSLKQVIVIAQESHELSRKLKKQLTSFYDQEHEKIEFNHLTQESQETCLGAKKIHYLGKDELFSIQQLLGSPEEGFPPPEEISAKYNLGSSELESLLVSPVVQIDDEQPLLSHLESAYYKTHTHITFEQLEHTLKANPGDIFAFVGDENDVKASFPPDQQQALIRFKEELPPINEGFILLRTGQEEEQFKQLCHLFDKVHIKKEVGNNVAQSSLHLLRKMNDGWIWTLTYSRHLYMKRHLYPVIVDKNKIKKDLCTNSFSSDFIVFSGIDEETLLESLDIYSASKKDNFKRSTAIFPENSDTEKEFERLSNSSTRRGRSIHWLKVTETGNQIQLQWHRSEGKINWIRSVLEQGKLDETKITSMKEESLLDSKARFILLADEPGMGKSTTLVHVTELMKQKKTDLWVMKIDLNRHQEKLASSQVKTLKDLVDVLSVINKKLIEPLTLRILMHQLTCPGSVALLWDGFDEVKLESQESVLALLKFLKKETSATCWVTTRRHDQEKLEEGLSILAHPFEPLNKEKQIDFLSRFWATALKFTGKRRGPYFLEIYANALIKHFEQSVQVCQGDQPFISIPLRARMLAEVYEESVGEVPVENEMCLEFFKAGKKLEIGDLYRQFIERKYEIYLREKSNIGNGLDNDTKTLIVRGYYKEYELLAKQELFDKRETALFTDDEKAEVSLNVLSRIGLIQGNEKPVNFVHRTFAEYFAGKWLAEHAKNVGIHKFLGIQLFKKESKVVRYFFDHFLTQNLLLHRVILYDDESAFKESLYENSYIEITDVLGRTALHLAAQEGKVTIIRYLQRTVDNKLIRDLLGKTPLHYAAGFGRDKAVRVLLENHVDINLDSHILSTPLQFASAIGNIIFNNPEYAKSKLVKLVNEKDKVDKSPLYYAADNGHWYTACSLLLHGADSSPLVVKHKNKLLRFVNERTRRCYGNQGRCVKSLASYRFELLERFKD